MNIHDRFRSPHLWINENGKWRLRHTVWDEKNSPNFSSFHGEEWEGNPKA